MSQIRADNITNRQGTGAPIFVNGIRVTGLTSISNMVANTGTFSGAVSIGGTLTYEDVTNIDAVGLITARTGVKVLAGGVDVTAGGIDVAGGGANIVGVITSNQASDFLHAVASTNGNDRLQIGFTAPEAFLKAKNSSGSPAANMGFYVTDTGGNTNKSIHLRYDGNVGLSTAAPATTLHVQGNYGESITVVSGTAVDCATGSYFTKTITGATTFTFTNVPSGVAYAFTFEVTLNGSNAITWPGSVKWPADTAPTITDGKTQVFVFLTDDGGTRWRGSSLVDYTN